MDYLIVFIDVKSAIKQNKIIILTSKYNSNGKCRIVMDQGKFPTEIS